MLQVKQVFEKCPRQDSNSHHLRFSVWKSNALPTEPNLTQFNGCFSLHQCLCALVWLSYRMCRLLKINFVILKDTAFILRKSHFNPCWHGWDICVPKMQMDRWTAFKLYIYSISFSQLCTHVPHTPNQEVCILFSIIISKLL